MMFSNFQFSSLKPRGWALRQLEIEAEGLAGNLDKMWRDVKDSAWIGGSAEGWERVPYWLDGFVPLAFLLDNADMKARAKHYIDAIVRLQKEDGWICSCEDEKRSEYDVWSFFLIGKVFAMYSENTGDAVVERSLYRAMKCLYEQLNSGKIALYDWGKFRWFEGIIPLLYLHRKYDDEWIIALGKILRNQGADYPSYCSEWVRPMNQWTFQTHIVNMGMMLKYEAVCCELFHEEYEDKATALWNILEKYNGTAVGTFTGDECLSGIGNNRGTELCSVTELMYSLEILYAATENGEWADKLEKAAFNALPATFSDDMWTHQYDQMVNQIACVKFPGKPFFRTNGSESHLFGLEPNFGCCTANQVQGWPKLIANVFHRSERGIVCSLMLPSELNTVIDGVRVQVGIDTEYPFRHTARYTVKAEKPVSFELKIRIPSWAKSLTVNGKSEEVKSFVAFTQTWSAETEIGIVLSDTPHFVPRPAGMRVAEYGALVFSLPIAAEYKKYEYIKDGVERKYPYCDYELYPKSEWRYGFFDEELNVEEHEGDDVPFSSKAPRITLSGKLARVEWEYADGYDTVSDCTPVSRKAVSKPESKELFPYGASKLRITEMIKTED